MDNKLYTELRSIVLRYGFKPVNRALCEVGRDLGRDAVADNPVRARSSVMGRRAPKRPRPTVADRVRKMVLPEDRRSVLMEAAERFDRKSFVRTIGDVRNFWEIYGLAGPLPKSRASAVPRLFDYLASMDTTNLRELLDSGQFSGPSRLGPIADAIRELSRERIRAYNERNGLPDNPESVSAAGAEDPDGAADDRS